MASAYDDDDDDVSTGAPTQPIGTDVTVQPPGFVPQSIGLFGGDPSLQGLAYGLLTTPKHAGFAAALGAGLQGAAAAKQAQQGYTAQQLKNYLGQQSAPFALAQNPINLQLAKNNLALNNAGLAQYGIDPTTGQPFQKPEAAQPPGMVPSQGGQSPWQSFAQQAGSNGQPASAATLYQRGLMLSQRPDPQSQRAGAQLIDAANAMVKNGLSIDAQGRVSNTPGSLAAQQASAQAGAAGDAAYKTVPATVNGVEQQVPALQYPGLYNRLNGQQPSLPAQTEPPLPQGQPPAANPTMQQLFGGAVAGSGPDQPNQAAQAQALGAQLNGSPAPAPLSNGMPPPPAIGKPLLPLADSPAVKAAQEKTAETIAAEKGVQQILSRLPSMKAKLQEMSALAPNTLSGIGVNPDEHSPDALGWRGSVANTNVPVVGDKTAYNNTLAFRNLNDQLFVNEIPALMNGASGMRMDIPLVKGVKSASGVPLEADGDGKKQIINSLNQNFDQTRDNALSYYKQLTGQDYDLGRAYTTPAQIKQAYTAGVIDKPTATKLLQNNHGFQ